MLGRQCLVPGRVDGVEADQLLEEPRHLVAAEAHRASRGRAGTRGEARRPRRTRGAAARPPRALGSTCESSQASGAGRPSSELPQRLRASPGRPLAALEAQVERLAESPRTCDSSAQRRLAALGKVRPSRAASSTHSSWGHAVSAGARRAGRRARPRPRPGPGRARRSGRRRRRPRRSSRPRRGAPGSRPRRIGLEPCLRGRRAGFLELARREVEPDHVRARPRGPSATAPVPLAISRNAFQAPGASSATTRSWTGAKVAAMPLVVAPPQSRASAQSSSLAAFVISVRARQSSG